VIAIRDGTCWHLREANARAPPLRNQNFADSPLEGAVSSEPVSGVRFPGYWEKIQGISAESQQERF
jgi:hypothetical protein